MADQIKKLSAGHSIEVLDAIMTEVEEARGEYESLDARLDEISGEGYSKAEVDALLVLKQNALSAAQLDAVNSGIDSTKVAQIETNKNNISSVANRQHIIVSPTRSSKSILAISTTGAFTSDMRGSILLSMAYQTDSYRPSLVLVSFNTSGFGSLFTWLAGSDAEGGTIAAIQRSSDYKTLYLTVRGSSFTAPMLIPLMDEYPEFSWQWLDSIPT